MLANDLELTAAQARAFVHGLLALAQTDGIHPAETQLIQAFHSAYSEDGAAADFSALIASPFDAAAAGRALADADVRTAFIQTCVFLAYADGSYSSAERARVRDYANAFGIGADALGQIEQAIGDHLLQQIARIENVDALAEVARELKSS